MNWKTTWLLVALAVTLFAFIWLVERPRRAASGAGQPPRLLPLRAAEVSGLQVRWTNELLLRAERTNRAWHLAAPVVYPAQTFAIESLLQDLDQLAGPPRILATELRERGRGLADYGLDRPQATLSLEAGPQRVELLFGAKTAVGDQVYLQVRASPHIHLAPAALFDRLPRTPAEWRDRALLSLAGLVWDRFEVRSAGRGFAVVVDTTNQLFLLARPTPARADRPKTEGLLRRLDAARVAGFVTDDPRADLEPYGLQPPEAEVVFGLGTNDLLVVQFGKSPTNDPALVFARCLTHSNIVLVPRTLLEAVQTPYTELRDRRLLAFAPETIERLAIVADEPFVLSRQTNQWVIEPPLSQVADPDAVRECLELLARLEGNVEKDVVTDFAAYGLAPPVRQYQLFTLVTNAAGALSPRLVAQLDLGGPVKNRLYARGTDTNSVFSIDQGSAELLPTVAWQMRQRQVWAFTTNQVRRLRLRHNGYSREFLREGPGAWRLAPGSQGIINPFALEELMFQLGRLRAEYWVDRGERNRGRYGFREDGYRLTLELQEAPNAPGRELVLEFAAPREGQLPLALATSDGQTWIFRFPLRLYFTMLRDLSNPPRPQSPPGGG